MLNYNIPISTLFNQVFGISPLLIKSYAPTLQDNDKYKAPPYILDSNLVLDESNIKSNLGTPVSFPMSFVAGNYMYQKNGDIKTRSVTGMTLPYSSIADFRRAKNITKTKTGGGSGTVKEQYALDDWQIRIYGFIIHNEKSLAAGQPQSLEDQVKALVQYEELADSIEVRGKMFEWLGIHKINILEIDFPGSKNLNSEVIKPFVLTCESDEPIELTYD